MEARTLIPREKVLEVFEFYIKSGGSDGNSKQFQMIRQMISQDNFAGDDNFTVVEYFTTGQLVARVWRRMLTLFNAAVEGKMSPAQCQAETSFLLDKLIGELEKVAQVSDPNVPRKLYLAKRPPRKPRHR